MDEEADRTNNFLYELYRQVDDLEIPQTSMHSVGVNIGMDKNETAALAEELMISDLVELKTLAGEIGITSAGLEMLEENGLITQTAVKPHELSGESVLTEDDMKILGEILAAIRMAITQGTKEFESLEEAVIDIKTIEVQLLSPRPKAAIVLAVLVSLKKTFQKMKREEIFTEYASIFARI